jgi:hypothetical protein
MLIWQKNIWLKRHDKKKASVKTHWLCSLKKCAASAISKSVLVQIGVQATPALGARNSLHGA